MVWKSVHYDPGTFEINLLVFVILRYWNKGEIIHTHTGIWRDCMWFGADPTTCKNSLMWASERTSGWANTILPFSPLLATLYGFDLFYFIFCYQVARPCVAFIFLSQRPGPLVTTVSVSIAHLCIFAVLRYRIVQRRRWSCIFLNNFFSHCFLLL